MMKLVYEQSPRRFGILLDELTTGLGEIVVGPTFWQQQKQHNSVPDLTIKQQAFTIAFEIKLNDWFHLGQIEEHVAGLKEKDGKVILFLLSNSDVDLLSRFQSQVINARENGILLISITYEAVLTAFETVCAGDDYLSGLLDEFREYLDMKQLLPRWKSLLDVVNCVNTMHEIESGAYMCPETKGAYNHKRARFLGPYAKKQVKAVYEIDAIVTISPKQEEVKLKWSNTTSQTEQQLFTRALDLVKKLRPEQSEQIALQVFLLGSKANTLFEKGSPGGMIGSKQYFWNEAFGKGGIIELAKLLNGKDWNEFL